MLRLLKSYWIYFFSFIFIALNALLVANEFYYFAALPFLMVIIFMAFFHLEKLMWFIVICTPLSLNLEDIDVGGIGMYLPTEPLMFGIMILFFLRLIYSLKFDKKVIYHPVSLAIIFNLIWIFITSISSEMPVVSFKFLLARMWFVVCFYFVGVQLFKPKNNYRIFFWSYIIPLTFVIIYSVLRLSAYGFEEKPAHWVMQPFYKDHTSYGAILAMYFPLLFLFLGKSYPTYQKIFAVILIGIFTVGLILSYTRAAWVSLAVAFVLFFIYKYRVRFSVLAIVLVARLLYFF